MSELWLIPSSPESIPSALSPTPLVDIQKCYLNE